MTMAGYTIMANSYITIQCLRQASSAFLDTKHSRQPSDVALRQMKKTVHAGIRGFGSSKHPKGQSENLHELELYHVAD
jgi:hypothetical protein